MSRKYNPVLTKALTKCIITSDAKTPYIKELLIMNKISDLTLSSSKRQENIELLRVISVILIIFYHLSRNTVPTSSADAVAIGCLSPWGILGVNCFVAISSYFLADQKFKMSRIINVFVQMVTWGIIFLFVRLIYDFYTKGTPVIHNFAELFCDGLAAPFWVTRYWFVWTYILLCIASPFINLLLNNMTEKSHAVFLAASSLIIIYGTFSSGSGIVSDLAYFIYIYAFVSYIKKYPVTFVEKHSAPVSIIMTAMMITSKILVEFIPFFRNRIFYSIFDTGRHSAFMVIMSLFVFCTFKNMKVKENKAVSFIALYSLGIYLFHENCTFNLTDFLYGKLQSSLSLPASLLVIIGSAILFIIGILADVVKKNVIDKPLIKLINKLPFTNKVNKFMDLENID